MLPQLHTIHLAAAANEQPKTYTVQIPSAVAELSLPITQRIAREDDRAFAYKLGYYSHAVLCEHVASILTKLPDTIDSFTTYQAILTPQQVVIYLDLLDDAQTYLGQMRAELWARVTHE